MIGADELLAIMKTGAENVGREFTAPDADWQPVMGLGRADGTAAVVGWDPTFLADDGAKFGWFAAMRATLAQQRATAVALVTSTWQHSRFRLPPGIHPEAAEEWVNAEMEAGRMVRPSQDPDRTEAVSIIAMDAMRPARSVLAEIRRHPGRPPTLGPWKDFPVGALLGGDVVTALREGLAWGIRA